MSAPQTRRSPAGTGLQKNNRLGGQIDYALLTGQPSSRPIDLLLPRFANVRQHGKGYRADCPCGHTSRGSLSVAEGDNEACMIHCFVGCSAHDVLAAVGLELADLYPDRVRDLSPLGRAQRREAMQAANVAAAVAVLDREAMILQAALASIERGEPLSAADRDRVHLAANRIHDAREALQ